MIDYPRAICAMATTVAAGMLAIASGNPLRTMADERSSPAPVTYFDHEEIAAAFAKGGELFGAQSGDATYRILTARRDGPGEVEIHKLDTDIMYVVSGTATFVTGGSPEGAKQTAPSEIRARSIKGGTENLLSKGEMIIIPKNTPHWYKDVQPPFLYLVVKVR